MSDLDKYVHHLRMIGTVSNSRIEQSHNYEPAAQYQNPKCESYASKRGSC
jgi:hypothetical protein